MKNNQNTAVIAPRLSHAVPMPPGIDLDEPTQPADESGYRMLGDGPSPDTDCDAEAVEVRVLWGHNVLHVQHLDAGRPFVVGDDEAVCDYFVPAAKLGVARAPMVVDGQAVLLPGAVGTVTFAGERAMRIDEVVASGRTRTFADVAGAMLLPLAQGVTVRQQLGDIVIEISAVKKARRLGGALAAASIFGALAASVGGSLLAHVGLLATVAAFTPALGDTVDEHISEDQRYLMKHYLEASAEPEKDEAAQELLTDDTGDHGSGAEGVAAKGEGGKMGRDDAPVTNNRFAIEGDGGDPVLARQRALRDAADFGAIGLLNDLNKSDGPIAPWGMAYSNGSDPMSADGLMWGDAIGDSWGTGGLSLTGTGEGGDGRGEGIGLTGIGTVCGGTQGCGFGGNPGGGFGSNSGRLPRQHKAAAPNVRMAPVSVSGRIPPEVIQRIVRQNFGRFRACYDAGLRNNPNLQGRVSVGFVIGRDGRVSNVSGGGDLPDAGVTSCITRGFYGLSFPPPENGIVTVTYPIILSPAGG